MNRLREIETKWQKVWQTNPLNAEYTSKMGNRQQYILAQFPYPSGMLHMGHARVYTISDCLARTARLQGRPVLHPMGWDAFGLPAENAARERGIDPSNWTASNVRTMRSQLMNLGFQFDWGHMEDGSGDLNTSKEEYSLWTRWLFGRLYKKGLAYRAVAPVHWDPVDQTVLADEQVDPNGRSWRSGALVEKRELPQWFFRITAYAERLLEGLTGLDGWPESVKEMQRAWIGRQEGFYGDFMTDGKEQIKLFVDSPEAMLWGRVKQLKIRSDSALHDSKWISPVWNKDLKIPINASDSIHEDYRFEFGERITNGTNIYEAVKKLGYKIEVKYRMRDWLVSRQRNWGCPIPIGYCPQHGPVLSNGSSTCLDCSSQLIIESDTMDTFVDSSWYFLRFTDPRNDSAIVDPHAVATWMPVSAYIGGIEHACMHLLYARFIHKFLVDELALDIPDEPFHKLVCQGVVMGRTFRCPQSGRILRPDEYRLHSTSGTTIPLIQIKNSEEQPARISWEKMSKSRGNGVDPCELAEKYGADAVRLNVLFKAPPELPLYWDDRDLVGQHRWLLRLFSLVDSYVEASRKKREERVVSVEGVKLDASLRQDVDATISQVTHDLTIDKTGFNTAIAALMKLSNKLSSVPTEKAIVSNVFVDGLVALSVMLFPMAPHAASEIYELLGLGDIRLAEWPELLKKDNSAINVILAVQRDGQTVGKMAINEGSDQTTVLQQVREQPAFKDVIPMAPKRIVFVPNRVINFCS